MLLQALVMSVILSMISVMVIRWVFSRYVVANQFNESAKHVGISTGYAMTNSSKWTIPTDATATIDNNTVVFHNLSNGAFTTTVTPIN